MNKLFYKITILALLIFLSSGCKKKKSTTPTVVTPPTNEVYIQNNAFSPSSVTVSVNTIIKWTNKDAVTHTVTSNSSLFDSGNIGNGGEYSHQFTAAGTFPYHCNIHSSMHGTIIVQ